MRYAIEPDFSSERATGPGLENAPAAWNQLIAMARRSSFVAGISRMIEESGRRQRQDERAQLRAVRESARIARASLRQMEEAQRQLAAAEAARVANESQAVEDFLDHPLANSGAVPGSPSLSRKLLAPKPFERLPLPCLDELFRQHVVRERHHLSLLGFGSAWGGGFAIAAAFGALIVARMQSPREALAVVFAVVPSYAIAAALSGVGGAFLVLAWRSREAIVSKRAKQATTSELAERERHAADAESAHDASERSRIAALQSLWAGEASAVESAVVAALDNLTFPIEIAAHVRMEDAKNFAVDIDLPEIEDLPQETCRVLKSGKLSYRAKTRKALREQYARFSGGLAFLYAAEVMRVVPTAESVTVSGFTERVDPNTGHDTDEYVVSARFDRAGLAALRLDSVDPIAAIQQFENRLEVGRSGELLPIEPLRLGA